MAKKSTERPLTVSAYRGNYREDVPCLRLQGKWLRDIGLQPGSPVKVLVLHDKLVITKDDLAARQIRQKRKEIDKLTARLTALKSELDKQG